MRKYYASLTCLTLLLVLCAFAMLWFCPDNFIVAMPLLALYFGVMTGVQHFIVLRAMNRSPKTFVQVFLGSTIGVLMVHLIVLAAYLLSSGQRPKLFLIAFCIGYAAHLVFETVALVRFVDREKKRRNPDNGQ